MIETVFEPKDFTVPAAHVEFRLDDLSPATIKKLGERILALDEDPGEHAAFVTRGNHLLKQGITVEQIRTVIQEAQRPHAEAVGGDIIARNPVFIDDKRGKEKQQAHIDGTAYQPGSNERNVVFANLTHSGATLVTTGKEHESNRSSKLVGFNEALRDETHQGLPTHLLKEVHPDSTARSTLLPGDAIFMRSGGLNADGVPSPGTGHAFDIAPEAMSRMTQPLSIDIPKQSDLPPPPVPEEVL